MKDSRDNFASSTIREPVVGSLTAGGEDDLFYQSLILILIKHYRILLFGPIFLGVLAYGLTFMIPNKYTSIAILDLTKTNVVRMRALITSPNIADKVLKNMPEAGDSPEKRIKYLMKNMFIFDSAPGSPMDRVRIFRFEFTHKDPKNAKLIGSEILDAWLETSLPGPVSRTDIEEQIKNNLFITTSIQTILSKMQKDDVPLIMPGSHSGEIGTSINQLNNNYIKYLNSTRKLQNILTGIPRDVIKSPPHLPISVSWPKRRLAGLLSALASIPIFIAFVIIRWYYSKTNS